MKTRFQKTSFGLDRVKVEERPIAEPSTLVIHLPFPPSVNNLFANSRNGGRYPTQRYEQWKTEAGWALKEQKIRRMSGPVSVAVELEDGARKRDCDNFLKPVCDLLVAHQIIEADDARILRKVSAEWTKVSGARVTIARAA